MTERKYLCQKELRLQGKPYPRTCQECGLGPCKYEGSVAAPAVTERVILPRTATEEMWEAGESAVSESFSMKYGKRAAAREIYNAMLAASPNAGAVSEEELRAVAAAIKKASSERRYGKYDYSSYLGEEPPFVIRDEKAGSIVFRSRNYAETEREYERLCDEHLARAALSSLGIKVK